MGDLADLQRDLRATVPPRWPWVMHKVEAPTRARCPRCYLVVDGQRVGYVEPGQTLAVAFTYHQDWDLHAVVTGHPQCLRAWRLVVRGHPGRDVLPDSYVEWWDSVHG